MHDIYPFILPQRAGEDLWRQYVMANYAELNGKYGERRFTGLGQDGYETIFSWYEVDVVVQSPIHVEFAVYGRPNIGANRGPLKCEISHSYDDTTLYPFINAEQRRVASHVLAERERLAAARLLEEKLNAVHQELFGEPLAQEEL